LALRALEKSLGGTAYSSSIARVTSETTAQAYLEKEMGRETHPRPIIAGCSTKSSDGSACYRPIAALTTAFFILSATRSALWGDAEWFDAWIARRLALTARRIC
jgi:hypothetical protein